MVPERRDMSLSLMPVVRLLDAMAREWPSFVEDLAKLGDSLSSFALDTGKSDGMKDMQSFDTLGQLAHAHGRLLEHIARHLSDATATTGEIETSIARIPFQELRARLSAALHGTESQTPISPESETVHWL